MALDRARLIGIAGAIGLALLVVFTARDRGAEVPEAVSSRAPGPYGDCVAFGQSVQFNMNVQSTLRNPASFEHVSSEIGQVEGGKFPISTVYRATNGFGAVDTAVATGEIRVADCAARVIAIE